MYTKALQTQLRTRSDDRASLGLNERITILLHPVEGKIFNLQLP